MQKLAKYGQRGDLAWCGDRIRELEEALGDMVFILTTSMQTEAEITAIEKANKILEDK